MLNLESCELGLNVARSIIHTVKCRFECLRDSTKPAMTQALDEVSVLPHNKYLIFYGLWCQSEKRGICNYFQGLLCESFSRGKTVLSIAGFSTYTPLDTMVRGIITATQLVRK